MFRRRGGGGGLLTGWFFFCLHIDGHKNGGGGGVILRRLRYELKVTIPFPIFDFQFLTSGILLSISRFRIHFSLIISTS